MHGDGRESARPPMKKFLAAAFASLMLVSVAAFAVPSATQIESSMRQGNWPQADAQLTEVLQAHPDSARAHYLYGQVLDREGRYADALSQIEQAKTLDPQTKFTDASRFAQVESKVRHDAQRAGAAATNVPSPQTPQANTMMSSRANNPLEQQSAPAPVKHGPSMGLWIGIVVLFAAIALILRWTLKRARTTGDSRADEDRRAQLRRATDLLNAVRSLKLDVKLSTQPGHEALEREVEGTEGQLRGLVETLSNSSNPVPPYQLDELDRQVASLRARAEGRPDPNAAPQPGMGGDSAYAREAERFGQQQPPYPYPPQQQPPVVVQQGGGFGSGVGGLLTGVLLGEALSGNRDRVIERDVIVDPEEEARRRGGGDPSQGVDFGQGSNDWSDGGGGGGVDYGSNDDSSDWNT